MVTFLITLLKPRFLAPPDVLIRGVVDGTDLLPLLRLLHSLPVSISHSLIGKITYTSSSPSFYPFITTSSTHPKSSQHSPAKIQTDMLERDLSKLLLDEEGAQVRQLPRAGDAQHGELDERPAHDARVGRLGLVAELGFALLFGT